MAKVDAKLDVIQLSVDALMVELADTKHSEVAEVKVKIRAERAKLVPYANLKAGIASSTSRANYFPAEMAVGDAKQAQCTDKFITFVESQL